MQNNNASDGKRKFIRSFYTLLRVHWNIQRLLWFESRFCFIIHRSQFCDSANIEIHSKRDVFDLDIENTQGAFELEWDEFYCAILVIDTTRVSCMLSQLYIKFQVSASRRKINTIGF
jgi:hypothetical protein